MSSPLQVSGESSSSSGRPETAEPATSFLRDIYAGGMMVYNGSARSDQRWIVVFTRMPGGDNGVWHTRSLTQSESGCEVTELGAAGPLEVIHPVYGCFTIDAGAKNGMPFAFPE